LRITNKTLNMETQKLSTKKYAINNGLLLGLISIVLGVLYYVLNMHLEQGPIQMVIGIAVTLGILILAFNQFKKANGGFMSLGQALKLGMGVVLISTILVVIWSYLLMNVIEPNMLEQMQELQMDKMIEDNPNMPQAQIDAAKEMSEKFSGPGIVAAFQLIGGLFFGFILSLITGLIMKKNNPNA